MNLWLDDNRNELDAKTLAQIENLYQKIDPRKMTVKRRNVACRDALSKD